MNTIRNIFVVTLDFAIQSLSAERNQIHVGRSGDFK